MANESKQFCVHCGGKFSFDVTGVGLTVPCPHCEKIITLQSGNVQSAKWKLLTICSVAFLLLVAISTGLLIHRKSQNAAAVNDNAKRTVVAQMPKQRKVSGQIFIVQENRETIKLSLVPIQLIATSVANERLEKRHDEAKTNLAKLYGQQATLNSRLPFLRKAQPSWGEIAERTKAVLDLIAEQIKMNSEAAKESDFWRKKLEADVAQDKRRYAKTLPEYQEAVRQFTKADTELKQLEVESSDVEAKIKYWKSPEIYFETGWSQVIAETTSDADGKFSIQVPEGSFTLAAHTSRLALSGKESFGWLVPIQENANQDQDILLSNNNFLAPP